MQYLNFRSNAWVRNIAYALPLPMAGLISKVSPMFESAFRPVAINRQYFSGNAEFCCECLTGCYRPFFSKPVLESYYRQFYWSNRNHTEGAHVSDLGRPNDQMLKLSRDRIDWIYRQGVSFESVIDFGAGDCAASYVFFYDHGIKSVQAIDPSMQASSLSSQYGLQHAASIDRASVVDLIFSSHSIEHVHDFVDVMEVLIGKTRPGGHLFFETPNIGNLEIFRNLVHTPHTFMLSEGSFRAIESRFPVRLIAIESYGPKWQSGRPEIQCDLRADLRVLLRRTH